MNFQVPKFMRVLPYAGVLLCLLGGLPWARAAMQKPMPGWAVVFAYFFLAFILLRHRRELQMEYCLSKGNLERRWGKYVEQYPLDKFEGLDWRGAFVDGWRPWPAIAFIKTDGSSVRVSGWILNAEKLLDGLTEAGASPTLEEWVKAKGLYVKTNRSKLLAIIYWIAILVGTSWILLV